MKTENIFIVHPKNTEQANVLKAFMKALKIKFEISKESPYNPDFVAKIERSREDLKEGKGTVMTIKELESLWK